MNIFGIVLLSLVMLAPARLQEQTDTEKIQQLINNAATGSEVDIPFGRYTVGKIQIPLNKPISVDFHGSRLTAAPGTTTVLQINRVPLQPIRFQPMVIKNVSILGSDRNRPEDGPTGIGFYGPPFPGLVLDRVNVANCGTGIHIVGCTNSSIRDSVIERNVVGLKWYQYRGGDNPAFTHPGGGANSIEIATSEFYLNQVGIVFDGTPSEFGMGNIKLTSNTIESNLTSGIVANQVT